jgi:ribosomal protein S18 acetylase RimI-like enzyme
VIDYRHMSSAEATAAASDLREVYAAVFSLPPYDEGPEMADRFVGWLAEESQRAGFSLVAAYDDGELVGFAYGYTMPPGRWWRRTDRPAPEQVKATDKFAVVEWAVLPERRGARIGRRLLDELLAGRREPYATLTVSPAAEARGIHEHWGWQQVATTKPGRMGGMDVLLLELSGSDRLQEAT